MEDTHSPLEVLCPRLHYRRLVHGSHSHHSLALHEAQEEQGPEPQMGGYIGIPQNGKDHAAHKAQASDDSESPAHACLIDRLAVEDLCIEATDLLVCISILEPEANDSIEIGNLVRDSLSVHG